MGCCAAGLAWLGWPAGRQQLYLTAVLLQLYPFDSPLTHGQTDERWMIDEPKEAGDEQNPKRGLQSG